jgi:hypothetical protein
VGTKVKTEEATEEDVEEVALGMLHKNHWFQQRDPALSL